MKSYGLDMKGALNIERLATLPDWVETDVGRTVFITGENESYLGGNSDWISSTSGLETHEADTTAHGVTGDVVGTTDAQTLTNKSIDANNNTITNIDNADVKDGANIDAAKIGTGVVSTAEFNYVNGVTSDIQAQIDAKSSLGAGQTWQNVTSTRATNSTTYTNTTGKVIAALISYISDTASSASVGGVVVHSAGVHADGLMSILLIIPDGSTYSVTITNVSSANKWAELR